MFKIIIWLMLLVLNSFGAYYNLQDKDYGWAVGSLLCMMVCVALIIKELV